MNGADIQSRDAATLISSQLEHTMQDESTRLAGCRAESTPGTDLQDGLDI